MLFDKQVLNVIKQAAINRTKQSYHLSAIFSFMAKQHAEQHIEVRELSRYLKSSFNKKQRKETFSVKDLNEAYFNRSINWILSIILAL